MSWVPLQCAQAALGATAAARSVAAAMVAYLASTELGRGHVQLACILRQDVGDLGDQLRCQRAPLLRALEAGQQLQRCVCISQLPAEPLNRSVCSRQAWSIGWNEY